ncbi:hypothetical protein UlMin_009506 [Ulmus minor]
MESQTKTNHVVKVANRRRMGSSETLLRILAFGFTLAAAILLGVDKQSKVVPVKVLDNLPALNVEVFAKWHYLSAFKYFVVANAIACTYAVLSLVLSLANRKGNNSFGLVITILDTVMVALLFSSGGAAGAIGLMGFQGNSRVRWNKVCNVFGKFCNQAAVSLGISLAGGIAFLLLVVLAAKRLHNKAV